VASVVRTIWRRVFMGISFEERNLGQIQASGKPNRHKASFSCGKRLMGIA
jgi:hypothetical protein